MSDTVSLIVLIALIVYVLIVSIVAVIITKKDKIAARSSNWRIKESTLLIVSALGGSVAMLATIMIIRHKTKKAKFMIGIPIIIFLQIALLVVLIVCWWLFFRAAS